MQKIITILILFFISVSCNKNPKQSTDSTSSDQTITTHFNEENHLFLNFYYGMTHKEYSDAILENIKERKIFPGMNDTELEEINSKLSNPFNSGEEYKDFKTLAYLDSINYNTEVELQNDFQNPYNRPFLYKLSIDENDYYTQMNPFFDNKGKLFAVAINVHLYNAYSQKWDNLSYKMLELKNIILKLYSSKYGTPKIKKESKNAFGYGIAGEGVFQLWDKNSYTFQSGLKTIILNQIDENIPVPPVGRSGSIMATNCTYYLTSSKLQQDINQRNFDRVEKEKARRDSIDDENIRKSLEKQKTQSTLNDI